jgi:hypothetical protein
MMNRIIGGGLPAAALLLWFGTAAYASCISGNTGDAGNGINLLSEANCQATTATDTLGGGATAVGQEAEAAGQNSSAFGHQSSALGKFSTSVGNSAGGTTAQEGLTAVGYGAGGGSAPYGVALGVRSVAGGTNSIAIGSADNNTDRAEAIGLHSIGIGFNAKAENEGTTVVGPKAASNGDNGSAFGAASVASGLNSVALGANSAANGNNSLAGGVNSVADATDAVVIGRSSNATATRGVALGALARATGVNAVALGSSSLATVANTVSVGRAGSERRITNVAAAKAGTDAVNLTQVKALIKKASRPASAASDGEAPADAAPFAVVAARQGAGSATHSAKDSGHSSHDASETDNSTQCDAGDMAGNWSLIATNIEEAGAGSVLWCETRFATTDIAGRYDVSGTCRSHAARESSGKEFTIGGQSLTVSKACRIAGALTFRDGAATFSVSILEGRLEAAPVRKTRAVMVSRWPRGGRFAIQTMVLQR